MKMSDASDLATRILVSARRSRALSDQEVALKAEMQLDEYLEIVRNPLTVPCNKLAKVFDALAVSEQEFADFSQCVALIAHSINKVEKKDPPSLNVVPYPSAYPKPSQRLKHKKTKGEK
jgi:hypothetical protein